MDKDVKILSELYKSDVFHYDRDPNVPKYKVWIRGNNIVSIGGDKETLDIVMPDAHDAHRVLKLLSGSQDIEIIFPRSNISN